MVLKLKKSDSGHPSGAGDAVCLRDDKRAGKIRATMSGRVQAHSQQKASPNTMSWMRMDSLKPESERDSGFSDASSEHLSGLDQMELDETALGTYPGAQASHLAMGAPCSGLSPMILMNNALLKQPNDTPPSPKPWGFQPTIEMLPQPQVVFLQPMVSANPSLQRSVSMKRRRSRKHLPILKSYPKIAPHPGDSSSEQGSSGSTERSSSASSQRGRRHGQKQRSCPAGVVLLTSPALPVTSSPRAPSPKQCPLLQEPDADSCGVLGQPGQPLSDNTECTPSTSPAKLSTPYAEAGALARFTWPVEQADGSPADRDCDSKRKRFCNTYNILSQSGLLDVALRVKELIRQSRRSQAQLERLQEQTGLFREAVQSGSPEVWTRLQMAMLEETGPEATEEEVKHAPERLP